MDPVRSAAGKADLPASLDRAKLRPPNHSGNRQVGGSARKISPAPVSSRDFAFRHVAEHYYKVFGRRDFDSRSRGSAGELNAAPQYSNSCGPSEYAAIDPPGDQVAFSSQVIGYRLGLVKCTGQIGRRTLSSMSRFARQPQGAFESEEMGNTGRLDGTAEAETTETEKGRGRKAGRGKGSRRRQLRSPCPVSLQARGSSSHFLTPTPKRRA